MTTSSGATATERTPWSLVMLLGALSAYGALSTVVEPMGAPALDDRDAARLQLGGGDRRVSHDGTPQPMALVIVLALVGPAIALRTPAPPKHA